MFKIEFWFYRSSDDTPTAMNIFSTSRETQLFNHPIVMCHMELWKDTRFEGKRLDFCVFVQLLSSYAILVSLSFRSLPMAPTTTTRVVNISWVLNMWTHCLENFTCFNLFNSYINHEIDTVNIPILQMGKLRYGEVIKWIRQLLIAEVWFIHRLFNLTWYNKSVLNWT